MKKTRNPVADFRVVTFVSGRRTISVGYPQLDFAEYDAAEMRRNGMDARAVDVADLFPVEPRVSEHSRKAHKA